MKDSIEQLIVNAWKLTVEHGQSSPKKTDYIHEHFGKILNKQIKVMNPNLSLNYSTKLKYEVKKARSVKSEVKNWNVPCLWGNTFSLDAAFYKSYDSLILHDAEEKFKSESHNLVDTIFLYKAQLTGYNQNRFNGANTLVGEIMRVFGNPHNRNKKICFINICPNQTVALKERKLEDVRPLSLSKCDESWVPLQQLPIESWIKKQVNEVNIYYDLDFGGKFSEQCHQWDSLVKTHDNFVRLDEKCLEEINSFIMTLK